MPWLGLLLYAVGVRALNFSIVGHLQVDGHHLLAISEQRLLLIGGMDDSWTLVEQSRVYDTVSDVWSTPTVTGSPPPRVYQAGIAQRNGLVHLCGGLGSDDEATRMIVYTLDITSWEWTASDAAGQPSPRWAHTLTAVPSSSGTSLVVYGGNNGVDFFDDVFVYAIATREWSQPLETGGHPAKRAWHSAVWVPWRGHIAVFGGQDSHWQRRSDVLTLVPGSLAWDSVAIVMLSNEANLPMRNGHSAEIYGDSWAVSGGLTDGGSNPNKGRQWLTDVQLFDYESKSFVTLGHLPEGITNHAMAREGRMLWSSGGTNKHWMATSLVRAELTTDACSPGFYASSISDTCTLCPPGSESTVSGVSACSLCTRGTIASEAGSFACTPCPPGYFADGEGKTECSPCAGGSFADGQGSSTCELCPLGRTTSDEASIVCDVIVTLCSSGTFYNGETGNCNTCPQGYIAPSVGSLACAACATNTFSNNGIDCRACPPGFIASRGSAACSPCDSSSYRTSTAESCVPCPTNEWTGSRGGTSLDDCHCVDGFYRAEDTCQPCPLGADCAGGSAAPVASPGHWSSLSDPLMFHLCINDQACPGGAPGTCGPGYVGPLCSGCRRNFYSTAFMCRECGPLSFLPFLVAIVVSVMILVPLCITKPARLNESMHKHIQTTAVVSLGVDFFQILGVFRSVAGWPDTFQTILGAASSFNFNWSLLRLDCMFNVMEFSDLYMFQTLLPAGFALVAYILIRFGGQQVQILLTPLTLFALKLTYIPILQNTSELFLCYKQDTTASWTLRKDPSINCYEGPWLKLLPFALLGLLLFGIGIPCLFASVLWKYKEEKYSFIYFQRFAAPMGIPYFRPHVYWWQMVLMFRKFIIGFLIPVLSPSLMGSSGVEAIPVAVFLVVLVIFMLVQSHVRPFKWTGTNWLEIVLNLVLIGLLVMFAGGIGANIDLLSVYVAVLCFAVLALFISFVKSVQDASHETFLERKAVDTFLESKSDPTDQAVAFLSSLPQEDLNVTLYTSRLHSNFRKRLMFQRWMQSSEESEDVRADFTASSV